MSKADYHTLRKRLDDPKLFWFKVLVTLTFTYGFRKTELVSAKVGYFDPKAAGSYVARIQDEK